MTPRGVSSARRMVPEALRSGSLGLWSHQTTIIFPSSCRPSQRLGGRGHQPVARSMHLLEGRARHQLRSPHLAGGQGASGGSGEGPDASSKRHRKAQHCLECGLGSLERSASVPGMQNTREGARRDQTRV